MNLEEALESYIFTNRITSLLNGGKFPHALLLAGPQGSAKLITAIHLAKFNLCLNQHNSGPCNACASCSKVNELAHVDLHFSYPMVGANNTAVNFLSDWRSHIKVNPFTNLNDWMHYISADNKQANINVKECNEIIQKLSMRSFEGGNRVMIIWMADYLGRDGNRLLKLIEEPPDNTFLIFVANDETKILNTILSRCQLVRVPLMKDKDLKSLVLKNTNIEAEALKGIAFLANGDINKALKLANDGSGNQSETLLEWYRLSYRCVAEDLMKWINGFSKYTKDQQKNFILYNLQFLRALLKGRYLPKEAIRLDEKEYETLLKIQKILNEDQIMKMVDLLDDAYIAIERNANVKILFLDLSIQMHQMMKNKLVLTN